MASGRVLCDHCSLDLQADTLQDTRVVADISLQRIKTDNEHAPGGGDVQFLMLLHVTDKLIGGLACQYHPLPSETSGRMSLGSPCTVQEAV